MPLDSDRLWTPLLTHYRNSENGIALDEGRMAAHIAQLRPHVRQYLIAGSTGDGWEMDDATLAALVRFTAHPVFAGTRIVFGALGKTTADVVRRGRLIESQRAEVRMSGSYAGIAACPPVGAGIGESEILDHYLELFGATTSPIAVYELPQVTGCSLSSHALHVLAQTGRVSLFKDTSGDDRIVEQMPSGVVALRGAEGGYVEALALQGRYDGWLLSTGNIFAPALRRLLTLLEGGHEDEAIRLSEALGGKVQALFSLAKDVPFGNAFSNANRVASIICWRTEPAGPGPIPLWLYRA